MMLGQMDRVLRKSRVYGILGRKVPSISGISSALEGNMKTMKVTTVKKRE